MGTSQILQCRNRNLDWGDRTLLMGILNVTPDSFSDGGRFFNSSFAIQHAYHLFEDGADIVDIGGESSRPGANPVPAEEEIRRLIPVIDEVAGKGKGLISVDTVKYDVAKRALDAGAAIINDISGLQREPRLAELAAETGAGLIVMHMRGTPQTMQTFVEYDDLISEVRHFFQEQVAFAKRMGVKDNQIALDPGIGFSKTAEQNLTLLNHLEELRVNEAPIAVGVSRKSFIGKITGAEVDERLYGTAGAAACSVMKGANLIRVHDVRAMKDVVAAADAIRRERII